MNVIIFLCAKTATFVERDVQSGNNALKTIRDFLHRIRINFEEVPSKKFYVSKFKKVLNFRKLLLLSIRKSLCTSCFILRLHSQENGAVQLSGWSLNLHICDRHERNSADLSTAVFFAFRRQKWSFLCFDDGSREHLSPQHLDFSRNRRKWPSLLSFSSSFRDCSHP